MFPNKEWLDTYKPCNGGSVLMGNDAVCKAGISTLKIKMFDGIVRILGNVRHVSDLRKNLIFTPIESSIDDAKFWHIQLGHMGERSMLELHKSDLLKGVKTCKMDFCKYCAWEATQSQFQGWCSYWQGSPRLCSFRCLGSSYGIFSQWCQLLRQLH